MVAALAALAIGPHGIGGVRFGAPKAAAVATLSARLGAPTKREVNPGCAPRYTEVEWGDLAVEFRSGTFSGFRYIAGGLPPTTYRAPSPPKPVSPRIVTANGISLGNTLAQVRSRYGRLQRIGADMWRASNRLVFVDSAKRDPVSSASPIREIKIGTCGDF